MTTFRCRYGRTNAVVSAPTWFAARALAMAYFGCGPGEVECEPLSDEAHDMQGGLRNGKGAR